MRKKADEAGGGIRNGPGICLHQERSDAINNRASAVFVLMRSHGFGPMSINKGPKRRIDGQASLHATSVFVCGQVVEVPKRFFGWPALLIRVRNLAASRHPRGGFF